jgi:hypothetical protein
MYKNRSSRVLQNFLPPSRALKTDPLRLPTHKKPGLSVFLPLPLISRLNQLPAAIAPKLVVLPIDRGVDHAPAIAAIGKRNPFTLISSAPFTDRATVIHQPIQRVTTRPRIRLTHQRIS